MAKTALLLIDIQNDYFPGFEGSRMVLPNMDKASEKAAQLLKEARANAAKIVHIKHVMTSDAAPFFKPGTVGAEIHESVAPKLEETVIEKPRPNSFLGTDLENHLREADIEQLVICGAMTQMCIDASVRAAVDLGFAVSVAKDACAAADITYDGAQIPADTVHAAILAPLAASYAEVLPASDCLSHLKG